VDYLGDCVAGVEDVMAQRFEAVIDSDVWGWRTRRSEDYVIIDGYLKVRSQSRSLGEFGDFLERYLEQGMAVRERDLAVLNQELKKLGEPAVDLVDGLSDSYAEEKGYGKAHVRQQILRSIDNMLESERRRLIARLRQDLGEERGEAAKPEEAAAPAAQPAEPPAGPETEAESEPKSGPESGPDPAAGAPARQFGAQQPGKTRPEGGTMRFEMTFRQTVERIGTIVVEADDLAQAVMANVSPDPDKIEWEEGKGHNELRMTGVREAAD
jgi:hypothetical protein